MAASARMQQLEQALLACPADEFLDRDERNRQLRLLHTDGCADGVLVAELADMVFELHEADGQHGDVLARPLQHVLDERLELDGRTFARRADRHDGLLPPIVGALHRHILGIDGLVAAEAPQRLIDALKIHARDVGLPHGLEDQRRRDHVERAHGNLELFSDFCAERHERAHVGEDQNALAAVHASEHRDDVLRDFLRILVERHVNRDEVRVLRIEELLRDLDHRARRRGTMHRDEDDDFLFEVVVLSRFQEQRDVLDLGRRHRHMIVMLDARLDFECDLVVERILLDGARDFRIRDDLLVLQALEERRKVQTECIEKAVAVAAVQPLLHEERNLLGKIDERLVDDLEQPVARRKRDAVALIVELTDVDVDVRRDDLLDEVVADALAFEQLDLVFDDAVEVECLLVLRTVARAQAAASGRLDDERLREVLRELRQRLPVRRERQQAIFHGLRQHAEIDLDVVRIVNAIQKCLRAEQLDIAL